MDQTLLEEIAVLNEDGFRPSTAYLASEMAKHPDEVEASILRLHRSGLITGSERYRVTPLGRQRAMEIHSLVPDRIAGE
jgi:Mn-dependent DtxR family transcriptional regulator